MWMKRQEQDMRNEGFPMPSLSKLPALIGQPMEMAVSEAFVSAPTAVSACAAMAVFYVAILYAPTVILQLPPPSSVESFLIRRFICAVISTAVSMLTCALLLKVDDLPSLLGALGIRKDHLWQSVVFPILLTSFLYSGTMVLKFLVVVYAWREGGANSCFGASFNGCIEGFARGCIERIIAGVHNVLAWRNYVVAPFTEELVFRACMIPLLLCGGCKTYSVIFYCPIFFSLAHLNHFLELYYQKRYSFFKAFMTVGLQLGYTVIFGWFAAFLFIRTGNVVSPIAAHIFCNVLGLPVLSSPQAKGAVSIAFAAGAVGFFWLLFPATNPDLYNDRGEGCSCWHRYCSWN